MLKMSWDQATVVYYVGHKNAQGLIKGAVPVPIALAFVCMLYNVFTDPCWYGDAMAVCRDATVADAVAHPHH